MSESLVYNDMLKRSVADRVAAVGRIIDKNDSIETSEVIAEALAGGTCDALTVQWVVERFWHLKMPVVFDKLNAIYDKLDGGKVYGRASPIDFNDLDDRIWIEPHNTRRVLVHTMQSINHLYVWEKDDLMLSPKALGRLRGFRQLHVRRFYDSFQSRLDEDKGFSQEEDEKFRKRIAEGGIVEGARCASWLQDYCDDGSTYPRRHSLEAYRRAGFQLKYGDCRDPGYVLSWQEFKGKVDAAARYHHEIEHVVNCYVPSIEYAVFGD